MKNKKLHFIGGGRITKIILNAFKNKNLHFKSITVSDTNQDVLDKLAKLFPSIKTSTNNAEKLNDADIVFVSLHPPVIMETLEHLKNEIKTDAIVISFAPKITIQKISENLNTQKVARVIPNATSIINEGYNPVCFSEMFSIDEKNDLMDILENLGNTFEVAEEKLEAYAISSAMLPTYFWFQWYEMIEISKSIGLSEEESKETIEKSLKAAIDTVFKSGLSKEEVLDLIPVKPIGDDEPAIKECLNSKLKSLFNKIKP